MGRSLTAGAQLSSKAELLQLAALCAVADATWGKRRCTDLLVALWHSLRLDLGKSGKGSDNQQWCRQSNRAESSMSMCCLHTSCLREMRPVMGAFSCWQVRASQTDTKGTTRCHGRFTCCLSHRYIVAMQPLHKKAHSFIETPSKTASICHSCKGR